MQYAKFNLKYQEIRCRTKREIFNLKNTECQQKFLEVTENTNKLSSCFSQGNSFLDQTSKFFKTLDGTFHQCFKKIRIKNKTMNVNKKDDIQVNLEIKTKLQMFLNESKSAFSRQIIEKRLAEVTEKILLLSSTRNKKIIDEHFLQLNNLDGTFSRIGMWKLKSKLLPNKYDPPTAKKDGAGNLITAVEPLMKLYLSTYIHRLRHRPIREDLQDLFSLKHKLWEGRLTLLKSNVAKPWTEEDLDRVIKSLKNNQTRDPLGMLNELFKPGVMGKDLKKAVLQLMNGFKLEMVLPTMMELSNITTLYKNKGSRFEMNNERGIFILSVLRKILNKLIYNDKYQDIDSGMSDSNIGARRGKNIKNHLFVIYGIINSILYEEKSCIDICIYDLEKAFDALWLEDCLIDLYDTLPEDQRDDKLALVYEANRSNLVAVKTAVGLTERVNIEKIVTQGGTFGPIECANSIDKVGQKCYNNGEHLFVYKKMVRVLHLSMVDDLLTISRCGNASLGLNTYVNAQIETKKLRFHTPDENGKTKCHFMHIGRKNHPCPELQVHGTKMEQVSEDTYLGDIISEDGKNTKNIRNRISKGVGIISQIMNMLETVTLGEHYFTTAVFLRESKFLNGILTNSEIWYGLTNDEINEIESLDRTLLRQIMNTPISTPAESLYLDLGISDIETTIKARRINYLYYLCKSEENEMLF